MSVLIVGFGNPLAGDDAVGWRAAEMLGSSLDVPGVRVMPCRQLTPELAADVAEASLAIFLDASVELPPGKIGCRRVTPQPAATPFTHHFTPAALLSLAEQIYGRRPEAGFVQRRRAKFWWRESIERGRTSHGVLARGGQGVGGAGHAGRQTGL